MPDEVFDARFGLVCIGSVSPMLLEQESRRETHLQ